MYADVNHDGAAGSVTIEPGVALAAIRAIDKFTDWTGKCVLVILVPLVLSNVVEVVMRYLLKQPTIWASDATIMANGSLFMLGGAYALLKGAHVRTDLLWNRFSARTKGAIDLVTYAVLFLPIMAVVCYIGVENAHYAYSIGERSSLSLWRPITWPFRAVIPIAAALLFIQGVSELLKGVYAIRYGREFAKHEKVEF